MLFQGLFRLGRHFGGDSGSYGVDERMYLPEGD
jgi:hypothetical protein